MSLTGSVQPATDTATAEGREGGHFAPDCFASCLRFVKDKRKEALSHKLCDLNFKKIFEITPLKFSN